MDRFEEIAAIEQLVDRTCIFKEKLIVRHVKVTKVVVDGWGASLSLQVVPTPGFKSEFFSQLDVSASWLDIGISKRAIGAGYAGWLLLIRPDLVERILSFTKKPRNEYLLMEFVNRAAYSADSV